MRFLTLAECKQFAEEAGLTQEEIATASRDIAMPSAVRVSIDSERHRAFFIAKAAVQLLGEFESALMWVTDFGIWPSSENRHLYGRLRHALGDSGTLNTTPGHLFLRHEFDDFITFVHLALEFGWGMNIVTKPAYRWIHASHDGWLRIVHPPIDTDVVQHVKGWSVSFEVEETESEKPARLQ